MKDITSLLNKLENGDFRNIKGKSSPLKKILEGLNSNVEEIAQGGGGTGTFTIYLTEVSEDEYTTTTTAQETIHAIINGMNIVVDIEGAIVQSSFRTIDEDTVIVQGMIYDGEESKLAVAHLVGSGDSTLTVSIEIVPLGAAVFELDDDNPTLTQEDLGNIYEHKYNIISIVDTNSSIANNGYRVIDAEEDSNSICYLMFPASGSGITALTITYDRSLEEYSYDETLLFGGTNDGQNWTALTINGETADIPSGGSTDSFQVSGVFSNNYEFTADAGEPSFDDCSNAFYNGSSVKLADIGADEYIRIIGSYYDENIGGKGHTVLYGINKTGNIAYWAGKEEQGE